MGRWGDGEMVVGEKQTPAHRRGTTLSGDGADWVTGDVRVTGCGWMRVAVLVGTARRPVERGGHTCGHRRCARVPGALSPFVCGRAISAPPARACRAAERAYVSRFRTAQARRRCGDPTGAACLGSVETGLVLPTRMRRPLGVRSWVRMCARPRAGLPGAHTPGACVADTAPMPVLGQALEEAATAAKAATATTPLSTPLRALHSALFCPPYGGEPPPPPPPPVFQLAVRESHARQDPQPRTASVKPFPPFRRKESAAARVRSQSPALSTADPSAQDGSRCVYGLPPHRSSSPHRSAQGLTGAQQIAFVADVRGRFSS